MELLQCQAPLRIFREIFLHGITTKIDGCNKYKIEDPIMGLGYLKVNSKNLKTTTTTIGVSKEKLGEV